MQIKFLCGIELYLMRTFDYAAVAPKLFTAEVVNLIAVVHENEGKRDLSIEVKAGRNPRQRQSKWRKAGISSIQTRSFHSFGNGLAR